MGRNTDVVPLLLLGLVIGANNLAAALALGSLGQRERQWRILPVFAAFEFVIPLAGLWLGRSASSLVTDRAGWISSALLLALGLWTAITGLRGGPQGEQYAARVTTWSGLFLLAGGLSFDNLIVGFSLGLAGRAPLLVAGTICAFSVVFTWLGLHLGDASRRHLERWAELGAGGLLIALGAAQLLGFV